jgi:hypothetical protein
VGFDDGHADDVRAAAQELQPEGQSNLTLAVRSAIADFAGGEFHRPGSRNQIVVFVGAEDECEEIAGQEIRDALVEADVQAVFRVFALDASGQGRRSLAELRRDLRGVAMVEVRNDDTVQGLEKSVQEAEQEERVEMEAVEAGAEGETTAIEEALEEENGEGEEGGEGEGEGEGGEELPPVVEEGEGEEAPPPAEEESEVP